MRVANADSDWDIHCFYLPRDPAAAWCGVGERHNFEKQVYGPRRTGAPADEPDVELGFHDALRVARLVAKGDQMTLEILLSRPVYAIAEENVASMAWRWTYKVLRSVDGVERPTALEREPRSARRWRKKWRRTWRETQGGAALRWQPHTDKTQKKQHRSPLAYVEEAPCVAELRYLAVRRTFGWRGAAAAYAKSAGGFLNSAAKSAEKLGTSGAKAGKQLGYALHRTLSAEWLLRERDVVGLPQGLPELLDGAIRAGALRDLPSVPAPLVALARRLADGLRGDAAVGSKEEFAAHLAALRSRLDVLVPLSRDLARDAPGPEGGEKSVALDVVRELDAWTRARLVEGLRALSL